MKDGDYIQELSEPLETKSWAQNLAEAKSVKEGMANLLIDAPDKYFLYGDQIERNLRRKLTGGVEEKDRELWEFTRPPIDLTLPVMLYGKSGVGK
eukprot:7270056-Prymnesium_polylepis.1